MQKHLILFRLAAFTIIFVMQFNFVLPIKAAQNGDFSMSPTENSSLPKSSRAAEIQKLPCQNDRLVLTQASEALAAQCFDLSKEVIIRLQTTATARLRRKFRRYNEHEIVKSKIAAKIFRDQRSQIQKIKPVINIRLKKITAEKFSLYFVVELKEGVDVPQAINNFQQLPSVDLAQPNYRYKLDSALDALDDPLLPVMWNLNNTAQSYPILDTHNAVGTADADIDAVEGWDLDNSNGGEGIIIGVVDTGVDYEHIDLAPNIWINNDEDINYNNMVDVADYNGVDDDANGLIDDLRGWDFVNNDSDIKDDLGHGTHVSGTIAAVNNNSEGVAGIAGNAKILATKVFDSEGDGDTATIIQGLAYLAEQNVQVINNSWSSSWPLTENEKDVALSEVIIELANNGVIVVFAAGNDAEDAGKYFIGTREAMENVILVAATNSDDELASFSNYGVDIDVAAPGVDILSLRAENTDMYGQAGAYGHIYNENYYISSGTSMSAPHVSGVAALLVANNPQSTLEQVRQKIRVSSDDKGEEGFDTAFGYGRLNMAQALQQQNIAAVKITSPQSGDYGQNNFSITAVVDGDYNEWRIAYKKVGDSEETEFFSGNTSNNIQYNWDISSLTNGKYYLTLRSYQDSILTGIDTILVIIDRNLAAGWPQYVGPTIIPPVYGDVDNDGDEEIVVALGNAGYGGWLWVFNDDGSVMAKIRPAEDLPIYLDAAPALADLDRDGDLEIIFVNVETEGGYFQGGALYAYHHTGELMWKTLYAEDAGFAYHSPVVEDINGDSLPEIIFGASETVIYNDKIFIFSNTGQLLASYYQSIENGQIFSAVAVADLENDGTKEIIVTTFSGNVAVISNSGELVWKKTRFDLDVDDNYHSLAVGDLDADGYKEIVSGFSCRSSCGGKAYVLNYDGSVRDGWPKITDGWFRSSISLADIDRNGIAEVIMGDSDGTSLVWRDDGQQLLKTVMNSEGSLDSGSVVGDFAGDEQMEIINADYNNGDIYAWTSSGELLPNWPVVTPSHNISQPALGDFNKNNQLDMAVTSQDGYVYLWNVGEKTMGNENFETPKEGVIEWAMFHAGANQNGVYAAKPLVIDNFNYEDSPLKHGWEKSKLFSGSVETVYDAEARSRILQVSSDTKFKDRQFGVKQFNVERKLNLGSLDNFSFYFKAQEKFIVQLEVVGRDGQNYILNYLGGVEGKVSSQKNIHGEIIINYPLGDVIDDSSDSTTYYWQIFERNISADISEFIPDFKLASVELMKVKGGDVMMEEIIFSENKN